MEIMFPGQLHVCICFVNIAEIPIPRYKLVVGVLSARDHFEQRQAIRETWWRHIQQNKTLAERFVYDLCCRLNHVKINQPGIC